jgi:uncharacterized membrane protein YhaH (DUF805 family)
MIAVHRGLGMLVPLFGIFAALLMNIVTAKLFGDSYYQEQRWPKLGVLLLAGLCCLVTGVLLKKKRLRDAPREQDYIASLSSRFESAKELAFSGPRDHLMFVPLQYWSLVYFAGAVFYVVWGMK